MRIFSLTVGAVMLCVQLSGQVVHLTDVDLPTRPIYVNEPMESLYLFADGDLLISTFFGPDQKKTVIYNQATGESTETDYLITEQYFVGEKFVYFYRYPDINVGFYMMLDDALNFIPIENLPAKPSFHYNGKSYGMNGSTVWEMSSNPLQYNIIASFPQTQNSFNSHSIYIADDTMHLSLPERYITINLSDNVVSEPYADYIEAHQLHRVPNTEIEGRHLYTAASDDGQISFHELGHQMAPRTLDADNSFHRETTFWTSSNRKVYFAYYGMGSFTNAGNYTWICLQSHAPVESIRIQHNLIRVDRRPGFGSVSLMQEYWRGRNYGNGGVILSAMDNGEKICALGLFGPEGNEPFGQMDDTISVLKDFVPGGRGSVDRYTDVQEPKHRVNPEFTKWDNKTWFIAGHPHIGHELTYSDGTVEGTHVLSDLVEGGDGIRTVRFASQDESLYALIQRDDLSFGIFEIGKNIELQEPISTGPETWEVALGGFPEVGFFGDNTHYLQSPIAEGMDGSLFYLTRHAPLGLIHGDKNDVDGFPDDNIPAANVLRLQKYNSETGELLFSKAFRDYNANDLTLNCGMVAHPDGTLKVLHTGRGTYREMDLSAASAPVQWGTSSGLCMINFSSAGEFLSIHRIAHEERVADVLEFEVMASGNMVALMGSPILTPASRYLMVFSADGELLYKKSFALQDNESLDFNMNADQSAVFLARYGRKSGCDVSEVRFFRFDDELRELNLGSFCYTGEIIKPQVHITGNGDRWYTGAGNGTVTFSGGTALQLNPADANLFTTFSALESTQTANIRNVQIVNNITSNYFGSFVRDGSVFLQSADIAEAPPGNDFNTTFSQLGYFIPNARLDLNTVRLDNNGQISEVHSQKMEASKVNSFVNYKTGFLNDGSQWQYVSSREHTLMHLDSLTPRPTYRRNFGYLSQLIKRPWPFGIENQNINVSLPDPQGNYLSLYPNPGNGSFHIATRNGNSVPYSAYEVYDMQGRVVSAGILPEAFTQIQIVLPGKISSGTYHVRFTGEGVSELARVIVIR